MIELKAYGKSRALGPERRASEAPLLLTPYEHFLRCAKMLFNKKSVPFNWHPWALAMAEACCEYKYVGFAGCGSSGKSHFMAVWAIINWLVDPLNTLVLITSTSIPGARKRVWKSIEEYWPVLSAIGVGRIINSPTPSIFPIDPRTGKAVQSVGIHLIPSEASKGADASGKMRGMKGKRVLLVADELSELSHAMLDTALSNLANNDLHICAASNPASYYDPFGRFVEPADGWNSINVNMDSWPTRLGGICLHFDALRNPNYLARENLYPIQKWEAIEEAVKNLGEESPMFWRDYRGFWCPSSVADTIYTEAEIQQSGAAEKAVWLGPKTRVVGIDPSFTSGGDRCVMCIGWFGKNREGVDTIEIEELRLLEEDANNTQQTRSFQIAHQIREIMQAQRINPSNLAVDASGAGGPFCDVLAEVLGTNRFHRVQFGGAATDRAVSIHDETPANEKYVNRVTELWFFGKELMTSRQLKGVTASLAIEMTTRKYVMRKGANMRLLAETKADMKARTGRSPDLADAMFVMLELCRERFGVRVGSRNGTGWRGWQENGIYGGSMPPVGYRPAAGGQSWRASVKRFDVTGKAQNFLSVWK